MLIGRVIGKDRSGVIGRQQTRLLPQEVASIVSVRTRYRDREGAGKRDDGCRLGALNGHPEPSDFQRGSHNVGIRRRPGLIDARPVDAFSLGHANFSLLTKLYTGGVASCVSGLRLAPALPSL